jgi:nucleoside-diphosphate-sugar epimerase
MSGKVLIIGGAAFIGSHLMDELSQGQHEARVLDNLPTLELARRGLTL